MFVCVGTGVTSAIIGLDLSIQVTESEVHQVLLPALSVIVTEQWELFVEIIHQVDAEEGQDKGSDRVNVAVTFWLVGQSDWAGLYVQDQHCGETLSIRFTVAKMLQVLLASSS